MGIDTRLTRKEFLFSTLALGLAGTASAQDGEAVPAPSNLDDLAAMERVIGFSLSESDRKKLAAGIAAMHKNAESLRKTGLPNHLAPAITFVPVGKQPAASRKTEVKLKRAKVELPAEEDIPFLPVSALSELIRTKKITSSYLTELYLKRIRRYAPSLLNVISITEVRARKKALQCDEELKAGKYRGPLHGIPYGIKDLFAAKGSRTTWGASPFRDQEFDYDSEVVRRLDEAGAVMVAKTSVGALAMDDHWFGGKTKNPWNPKQGSSGSSAGSASGMAAGLFGFAIGTETLGSIMSPSHRCRVTGLRPTFGRVSRHGAMALSWTMDKVGPICRTAEDCALVFAAILGEDVNDTATVDRPFLYGKGVNLKRLKIALLENDSALDEDDKPGGPDEAVAILRNLGAQITKRKFTPVPVGVDDVLSIESAAAFDSLCRTPEVDTMEASVWPDIFRTNEFATGVNYLQAMQARTRVMAIFEEELGDLDVVITSDRGSYLLFTTNLTGHPQLYIPLANGRGISLIGRLHDESTLLALGAIIQQNTAYWKLRPDLSVL